jgi:glucokinase
MDEKVLGIDVGKTKIASGIVSQTGLIEGYQEILTDISDQGNNIINQVKSIIQRYIEDYFFFKTIGIGSFGLIDHAKGIVIDNGFLPKYRNLKIKNVIKNEFNCSVNVENDLYTSAMGEYLFGVGKGCNVMVFVGVGTSVGSAIILNGNLIRGKHQLSGQIAHILCDNLIQKTIHDLTGGSSIAIKGSLALSFNQTTTDVFHHWKDGNPIVTEIVADFITQISTLLAIIQNFLDPDILVLGGGVINNSCESLFTEIQNQTMKRLYFYSKQLPEGKNIIKKSLLGTKSGVIGAAYLCGLF